VGRHDDFFALGGHSLLVVRMVDRLRQAGLRLELRAIFEVPTLKAVAGMTQPLAAADAPFRYLVPLRVGGPRRPLFLAHEPSGEVLSYGPLASHLDGDLPVYGLQADHGDLQARVTNEMLAARYLREVRTLQPRGPYRLAGWSAGGLLAYEMARQLRADGEPVEFLGMIDSGCPDGELPADFWSEEETRHWRYLLGHLVYLDATVGESRAHALEALYSGDVGAALAHCHREGWLPPSFSAEELAWRLALTRQLTFAFHTYRPQPLPMQAHLFCAEAPTDSDPSLGWASQAECTLEIVPVGGSHLSIVKGPHAQTLAAAISRLLAATEPDRAPTLSAPPQPE
jgi:thioesterase domain-containing protein